MTLSTILRFSLYRFRALRLRLAGATVGPDCQLATGIVARRGVRDGKNGTIAIGRAALRPASSCARSCERHQTSVASGTGAASTG